MPVVPAGGSAVVVEHGRQCRPVRLRAGCSGCGIAPLWLDSLGTIIAVRVLTGVAEAAIMTCCTTLIADYCSGRRRVRYLALQTMCASASATAFLLLGGAVGAAGWRAPFWVYAVSLLLAPLMTVALPGTAHGTGTAGSPGGVVDRRAFRVAA